MNDLVRRLLEPQPVEADLRPENTLAELKDAVERGVVHVKFTKTSTTLGVPIDRAKSNLAALSAGKGTITVAGELTLNYERVRAHADLDLGSLRGTGRLEHLENVDPWVTAKQA
jgi:hypothetical protein